MYSEQNRYFEEDDVCGASPARIHLPHMLQFNLMKINKIYIVQL